MQNSKEVCRPPHLTTRWVEEITDAISRVCKDPNIRRVVKSRNPEFEWRVFQSGLSKSYCSKSRIIEDILSFRVDYNEYRK